MANPFTEDTAPTPPASNPQSEALRAELANYYGSEHSYPHSLVRDTSYTDGARAFFQKAGAYWLLDILATEPAIRRQGQEFAAVTLLVGSDAKAVISVTDGNDNEVFRRDLTFTTCPPGTWKFFIQNRTIMLPSEY